MQTIKEESLSLNHTGEDLVFLLISFHADYPLFYENYIWEIEKLLEDIMQKNITSEKDIHEIGKVIQDQNKKFTDMIFIEEIGVKGINTKESLEKITNILNKIDEKIKEVYKK